MLRHAPPSWAVFPVVFACGLFAALPARAADAPPAPQGPAPAQPPESSKLIASEPLEVTVTSDPRIPDTWSSSRAASRVADSDIRVVTPGSFADALRGRAGVSVQQTTPGQGTVYVRGLSGREVMHLVDGVPLNAAIFRAGNNPYLGLVDPYSLQEIEVIRGSSSVLHGSDALGGVIAMMTALPGYSLVEGGETHFFGLQSFSVNPLGSATRAAVSHQSRRWAVYVGLTRFGYGDIAPGRGEPSPIPSSYVGLERSPGAAYEPATTKVQIGTAIEMYAGNAALRAKLSERAEIVLRGQFGYRPNMDRYDQITPRFKNEFPDQAESSLHPFHRAMASATLSYHPDGTPFKEGIFQVGWQRLTEHVKQRRLRENCIVGGEAADEDPCTGTLRLVPDPTVLREKNRSDALSARAEVRLANARRDLGVRLGLDAVHDRVTSSADDYDLTTLSIEQTAARFPSGSSQTLAGLYGQVEAAPTSRLRVHAGVRGALFHLDIADRLLDDGSKSPAYQRTIFDVIVNAGIRWELSPGVSWVVNGGRGVRAPNVQDFSALGARARGRFQLPNPNVRPEHTLSLDTGLKAMIGGATAEAYVFYLRYSDAITLAPATLNGATTTPNGETYERSENAARVDYIGGEAMLRVPFASFIGVEAHALAMMGTQYNDAASGLPEQTGADRAPPAQATLGLWVEPVPVLKLEAIAHGRLRQQRLNDPTNIDDNRIPEGGTPGFVTLRVQGTWRIRRGLTARLVVDNVTDQLVLEHGSGFYRPGINGTLGVEASF